MIHNITLRHTRKSLRSTYFDLVVVLRVLVQKTTHDIYSVTTELVTSFKLKIPMNRYADTMFETVPTLADTCTQVTPWPKGVIRSQVRSARSISKMVGSFSTASRSSQLQARCFWKGTGQRCNKISRICMSKGTHLGLFRCISLELVQWNTNKPFSSKRHGSITGISQVLFPTIHYKTIRSQANTAETILTEQTQTLEHQRPLLEHLTVYCARK